MQEHAADVYGLEVVHGLVANSQEAGARAEQVLGEADLADPKPSRFIVFWLYSHPPQAEKGRSLRTRMTRGRRESRRNT